MAPQLCSCTALTVSSTPLFSSHTAVHFFSHQQFSQPNTSHFSHFPCHHRSASIFTRVLTRSSHKAVLTRTAVLAHQFCHHLHCPTSILKSALTSHSHCPYMVLTPLQSSSVLTVLMSVLTPPPPHLVLTVLTSTSVLTPPLSSSQS